MRRGDERDERDERGQGSLENVGMIVLVSALVIGTIGVIGAQSEPVRTTVAGAICRITSGVTGADCASAPDGPTTSGEDAGAEDTNVEDTDVEEVRTPVCEPSGVTQTSGSYPDSVVVEIDGQDNRVALELEVGEDHPDQYGQNWTDVGFSVRYDDGLMQEVQARNGFGVDINVFGGGELAVDATVPSGLVSDLAQGSPVPDPLLPESIPPGVSLTLTQSAYAGVDATGAYRGLVAAMEYQVGGEVSLAVTGLEDGQVQVSFGTAAAVEYATTLGLGVVDTYVGLNDATDLTDYELQQFTIDLESADGQAAYYALLAGDVEAAAQSAGVVDQATVTGGQYAATQGIVAEFNGISLSENFYDNNVDSSITTHADGTTTATVEQVINGQVRVYTETFDASGERIDLQTQVRLNGVTAEDATGFNQWFAGDEGATVDDPVNMVLDYDLDDIQQIQDDAIDILVSRLNNPSETSGQLRNYFFDGYDSEVTREEVEAWLAGNPSDEDLQLVLTQAGGGTSGGNGVDQAMINVLEAVARNPDDPWATWAGFTDGLELSGPTAATTLMGWASAVEEATGTDYTGFGSTTCVTVA